MKTNNYIKIYFMSLLIFVSFTLFMFLYFKNYIIEKNQVETNNNIINTEQYIKNSINFIIQEKKNIYIRLSNIIFSDKNVIDALKRRDRKKFYNHTKEYYSRAKKRDENFWGLHIILPNNLSFIRVHKAHVKDKLIQKGKKPSIDKVNETKQIVTNFEVGKFGYFLRVNIPIFSTENDYLGVAEFSISVDSLTQYIKDNFNYESIFLVKNIQNKEFLATLPKTKDNLVMFKSTNPEMFKDLNFKKINNHNEDNAQHSYLYKNEQTFNTVITKLSDSATLVTAFDITSSINERNIFEYNINYLFYFITFVFFIIWFFATNLYITTKKQINHKLKRFNNIISTHVNYSNTDLDGVITEVSHEFCRISGYSKDELIGSSHNIIKHQKMNKAIYTKLWETITKNKTWKGELRNTSKNGRDFYFYTTISPLFNENNEKIGYASVREDITDKKIIEKLSITDGLTELYNRRHFDIAGSKILNQVKRDKKYLSFLILDIDNFKLYNDTYGHVKGDVIIKVIADAIRTIYKRNIDYVFRIGGEEFAIISSSFKKDGLVNADTLVKYIHDLNILHEKNDKFNCVTVSIGLVNIQIEDDIDIEMIYKAADEQLYKSKKNGKNKTTVTYSI